MDHLINYILIALAVASFVFVCLNWDPTKRA
jgi:hypothetical protein